MKCRTTIPTHAGGPSLTSASVQKAIEDPTLEVHEGNGNLISNDDWQTAASGEPIPVALQPRDPRESALQLHFSPGGYSAIVRGKGNATGVALVEAYNLP